MAAAVPLALAVLEAAVPLADLESDLESDFVVLDTASEVFVDDPLGDVEAASARNVNNQSRRAGQDHQSSYHSLNRLACVKSNLLYLCMMVATAKLR